MYNKDLPICLPPMELLRHTYGKGGHPQTRCICNDMDESKVEGPPLRRCMTCEEFGHKTVDRQTLVLHPPEVKAHPPQLPDMEEDVAGAVAEHNFPWMNMTMLFKVSKIVLHLCVNHPIRTFLYCLLFVTYCI